MTNNSLTKSEIRTLRHRLALLDADSADVAERYTDHPGQVLMLRAIAVEREYTLRRLHGRTEKSY